MYVCCFDEEGREIRHQLPSHTLGVWHGEIPGLPVGQLYGLRADGPWDPAHGRRFNVNKLLLDPYARAISGTVSQGHQTLPYQPEDPEQMCRVDSASVMPRCVVVHDEFDWQGDRQPRTKWHDTVIYELHVKGMTQLHNEIPEELRGTFAGLATPTVINYLKDLGITAVELLPSQQFLTEPEVRRTPPTPSSAWPPPAPPSSPGATRAAPTRRNCASGNRPASIPRAIQATRRPVPAWAPPST